jgi:hypothetical protein
VGPQCQWVRLPCGGERVPVTVGMCASGAAFEGNGAWVDTATRPASSGIM